MKSDAEQEIFTISTLGSRGDQYKRFNEHHSHSVDNKLDLSSVANHMINKLKGGPAPFWTWQLKTTKKSTKFKKIRCI
jgi:pyocin large subunit-like protein